MRILVIEDDHKIAKAIKRGLEQQSYAVDVVYDGDDGLTAVTSPDYDLFIIDRMLPGSVDGIEIISSMRAVNDSRPALLLTAKDKPLDKAYGLNSGADDYLAKPFAFVELIARVRALLRRPQESTSLVYEAADLRLDSVNKTVIRGDKPINLTSKEFALVEYFMRNQQRIINKDELMSHVWNDDADILPNTVEVYVGYVRNKIDKPFKGPKLLSTKRGFGYYFGVENVS